MNKYDKGLELVNHIIYFLKPIDNRACPTTGSGNKGQAGDVQNKYFIIESKNWDKKNVIVAKGIFDKLMREQPIDSNRLPILIQQNNTGEIICSMRIKDLFELIYNAYRS